MAERTKPDASFEALLDYIKWNRGFDFTGYKRASLLRRFQRRMETVGIAHHDEYRAYLEAHPEEFQELFDTILINVTKFFRDAPVWEFLSEHVVPQIVDVSEHTGSVRAWSAGCSTGEEAYTIAMVLAEALGPERFRERVKIYATDVDEAALTGGRHANYPESALSEVPEELRMRYFDRVGGNYVVKAEVRRAVVFGRHDLMQDPPISKVDLLSTRNTLMYFQPAAQTQILASFHFALRDTGFLFLGRSEVLRTRTNLFAPVDLARRVFAKVPLAAVAFTDDTRFGVLRPVAEQARDEGETPNEELQSTNEELETTNEELQSTNEELETMNEELHSLNEELQSMNEELDRRSVALDRANAFLEAILAGLDSGVVVLDDEQVVTAWNHAAEEQWGVTSEEAVGRHVLNLDIGLPVEELRQAIRATLANGSSAVLSLAGRRRGGERGHFDVTVTALRGPGDPEPLGVILLLDERPPR